MNELLKEPEELARTALVIDVSPAPGVYAAADGEKSSALAFSSNVRHGELSDSSMMMPWIHCDPDDPCCPCGSTPGCGLKLTQNWSGNGAISDVAGVKLPSGLIVSGAWGSVFSTGSPGLDAVEERDELPYALEEGTDPSFFEVEVSYAFGEKAVATSWYESNADLRPESTLTRMMTTDLFTPHAAPAVRSYEMGGTAGISGTRINL